MKEIINELLKERVILYMIICKIFILFLILSIEFIN